MKSAKLFRKMIPWKEGDKCAVQLKTKKVYGSIYRLGMGHEIKQGKRGKLVPYAIVEYETRRKSIIPHVQMIDIRDLLEDDRE